MGETIQELKKESGTTESIDIGTDNGDTLTVDTGIDLSTFIVYQV